MSTTKVRHQRNDIQQQIVTYLSDSVVLLLELELDHISDLSGDVGRIVVKLVWPSDHDLVDLGAGSRR